LLNFCQSYEERNTQNYKHITMSAGVFECHASDKYDVENIFTNADSALYYAKEHGRNQLILYKDIL